MQCCGLMKHTPPGTKADAAVVVFGPDGAAGWWEGPAAGRAYKLKSRTCQQITGCLRNTPGPPFPSGLGRPNPNCCYHQAEQGVVRQSQPQYSWCLPRRHSIQWLSQKCEKRGIRKKAKQLQSMYCLATELHAFVDPCRSFEWSHTYGMTCMHSARVMTKGW